MYHFHDGASAVPLRRFVPDTLHQRDFRDALGRFATGVTVVTTAAQAGPVGITANSFASVSLDPPIVLWSVARNSSRFEAFAGCEHFAIHVLAAEQIDIGRHFTRNGNGFDAVDHVTNEHGVPLLAGCLSRFECRRLTAHDGGDHLIVVASVTTAALRDGAPLLFASGEFGRFERFERRED